MLVTVLDGQLTLVAPKAPNPYAARTILERTPELHTFTMRPSGAFGTHPVGEHFTFSTGAGGEVTGYLASGPRFVRKPTFYISVERRRQPQTPDISVERPTQPQVRYIGTARRARWEDRRSQ